MKCTRCGSPTDDRCPVCDHPRCTRCMPNHQTDTDTGVCHDLTVQRETLFGTADGTEASLLDHVSASVIAARRERAVNRANQAAVDRARRMSKAADVDPGDLL